tara:strand:+ start:10640 stop:10807 length:168 start_codon:yes stop_codon:yes gene_type:complete
MNKREFENKYLMGWEIGNLFGLIVTILTFTLVGAVLYSMKDLKVGDAFSMSLSNF